MSEPSHHAEVASAPLSVILFAHALSAETDDAVRGWRDYLETLSRPYEILLVQETRPEVPIEPAPDPGAISAGEPPCRSSLPHQVFLYERALGFRIAFNDAIRAAKYPLLAFCPADRQYRPGDLDAMLKLIDQVEMVTGCRAGYQPPPWQVLLDTVVGLLSRVLIGVPLEPRRSWLGGEGWGRRWVARWIFGVRVTDPECPFRLARRDIFHHLPIQSSGPFVHVEILAKANHLSCFLAEELVTWTPPAAPQTDAISFGEDARLVFRDPDFGPPTLANMAADNDRPIDRLTE